MTASENLPPGAAPASPVRRRSRLLEWFWRGEALRQARETPSGGRDAAIAAARARIAAEVGGYALDPAGPWASGPADHLACALFAESIGWSLHLASALPSHADAPPADGRERPPKHDELAALLETHAALLAEASNGREAFERVRKHLLDRDFEIATLRADDAEQGARELRGVAERLLKLAGAPQSAADRVMFQRFSRVGGLLFLAGALLLGLGPLRERLEVRADLSRGKPWAQSSVYEQVCSSPLHQCGSLRGYFFHTQEEASPWLEIDLQRTETVSGVHVFNRQDCCADRAVPLLVEVSTDHQKWREVARKTDVFDDWRPSFRPVATRWVRFRVARPTLLHFVDVRVLP